MLLKYIYVINNKNVIYYLIKLYLKHILKLKEAEITIITY